MSSLRDEQGLPLIVEPHQQEWQDLFRRYARLVLLAPRDHGKSICVAAYLLWRAWRHNRHPDTGRLLDGCPEGSLEAVLWSATLDQTIHQYDRIRALMLANEWLFLEILPEVGRAVRARDAWSRKRTRLRNGFEFSVRAFRTSTRGLHPDISVFDDPLNDQNSLSSYQRSQTWRHFAGTILPMNPKQLIVVGTAFHHDDLLHKLRPKQGPEATAHAGNTWEWRKYRALDADQGVALWPARHPVEELRRLREFDPVAFAREFQNDPTDEASSLFPFGRTERMLNSTRTFGPLPRWRSGDEFAVLGYDVAASAEVAADFCSLTILAVDLKTLQRRWLWGYRAKGLSLDQQVQLLRDTSRMYGVRLGVVEQNGFQRWLCAELRKYPETSCIFGHNTGLEKCDFEQGIPSLRISLASGLWDRSLPTGDAESAAYAAVFRAEGHAFGWKDGKLMGVGEHDDTVMSWWFADRAARMLLRHLPRGPEWEMVYLEDLGIERVRIGPDI